MSDTTLVAGFYVFVLAAFLGYQVISRVPPLLHTPLMSATNAISGISLIGSLVTAGANVSSARLSSRWWVQSRTCSASPIRLPPRPKST